MQQVKTITNNYSIAVKKSHTVLLLLSSSNLLVKHLETFTNNCLDCFSFSVPVFILYSCLDGTVWVFVCICAVMRPIFVRNCLWHTWQDSAWEDMSFALLSLFLSASAVSSSHCLQHKSLWNHTKNCDPAQLWMNSWII